MSRRYTPAGDPADGGLAAVLAGRVDALENDLRSIRGDVTAIGRGITDLTSQIRQLTPQTPAPTATPGRPAGLGGPRPEPEELEAGQPDWFEVDEPDVAQQVITGLTVWTSAVLAHYGITLPVPCWPLHPAVVADLLALDAERAAAYAGPTPTPVSEFLARWLPATRDRIAQALHPCVTDRAHRENGKTYDISGFDPLSAATWWATDRLTPAPAAFALPELT